MLTTGNIPAGWSPQTFTSSRKNRAEFKQQSILNFLDDDEKAVCPAILSVCLHFLANQSLDCKISDGPQCSNWVINLHRIEFIFKFSACTLQELEGDSLGTSMQFDTFGSTAAELARKQAEKEQQQR